ncbi:nucleotidyltransferase [Oceanobacillus luteolus]|uniref:tRNA(Met) cytidine acetate ligase n=1 Tax=Oceanobacillus luteolus TaxID=1274358 RepID=A0ABW4HPR2_9BACI|nr:nucleotidyltransferase [Oceanobacillus luteolus]MCM3739149.1 nucleotidyltransferase [Oceanobacillus luteolus]
MKSCGVIVEYNPFHNGHAYHIQEAKKVTGADTVIAVMSGNFLQRGEPAIIDKYHRAEAALSSGIDLVLELPYAFAVQNSDLFAKGAVNTLHKMGVSSICFGSEAGDAAQFKTSFTSFLEQKDVYEKELKHWLNKGLSFPEASMHAYGAIGLTTEAMDLSQPNNILGMSYVKTIMENKFPIEIHTIKRINNHFHEPEITNAIASATSIRNEMIQSGNLTSKVIAAIPDVTLHQLQEYKRKTTLWHQWENYFQILNYRVQTMTHSELRDIHGVVEGLEYRLSKTAKYARSMQEWMESIKTKRYTWTRIQRLFVHLLTNTRKSELDSYLKESTGVPYVRLLGMTERGQRYLNKMKKTVEVPIITNFSKDMHPMLQLEERATAAYYSILSPETRLSLSKQELRTPLRI